MENKKYHKNKLGLGGWLSGGRYGAERYAYTLHRITGLGILLYFILHIYFMGARLGGVESWNKTMQLFDSTIFHIGEYLVLVAFIYHALNGLRLVFIELGQWIGKPQRPIYPYVTSVKTQRPIFVVLMIVAAVFILVGGYDFFLLH
jgi:succinate dehydrogenase / fumarate reductase cytochrome b subunit